MGWGVIAFGLLTATGEAVRSLNAVKRKDNFYGSPGFEAQNLVRVANFHGCFPDEIELAPQRNKNF